MVLKVLQGGKRGGSSELVTAFRAQKRGVFVEGADATKNATGI
jgi:hypothetical protein